MIGNVIDNMICKVRGDVIGKVIDKCDSQGDRGVGEGGAAPGDLHSFRTARPVGGGE